MKRFLILLPLLLYSFFSVSQIDHQKKTIFYWWLSEEQRQYSEDATTVLERFSGLSTTQKNAIASFVDKCVSNGNWTLVKEVQIRSLGSVNGLIGLKGAANATNNGATFNIFGATGNGTSTYINTGVNLSTIGITQNNILFGGFVSDNGTQDISRALWGGNVGTERTQIFTLSTGTYSTGANSTATDDTGIAIEDIHLLGAGRGNGTTNYFEVDGIIVDTNTRTSAAPSNANLFELARNNNGTPLNHSNGTIALFYIASGIGFDRVSFNLDVYQLLSDLGVFFLDRFPYTLDFTLE